MPRKTTIATIAGAALAGHRLGLALAQATGPPVPPAATHQEHAMSINAPETGYAPVNGLRMYDEIHGREAAGTPPLLLLHGAYSNIETDFGRLLPTFAQNRPVIAVEQQAHGRTADIDRPLGYDSMDDDTAALLRHLGIGQADIFAYSFGGGIAAQLALRHPAPIRKLVLAGGTAYAPAGLYPELLAGLQDATAEAATAMTEMLAASPWGQAYARIAPHPDAFPNLVA